ncbi:MAG: hypothetical protein LC114_14140 [Bryobacterales bacterium]|nr:hypothetical protein [Bryobacterales bacterium]
MRVPFILTAALLTWGTLAGCSRNVSYTPPPDGTTAPASNSTTSLNTVTPGEADGGAQKNLSEAAASEAGGVRWSAPEGWTREGDRPMRAASYSVPASPGDPEAGECAVFYFGPNEGGGVDANISRWIGQMKQPDGAPSATRAKTRKLEGSLPVTLVDLTGTYLASGGPMMQTTAEKSNFRLLGAIVQGPQGAVFFKLTGPEKTVETNAEKFLAMVQGAALTQ